MRLSLYGIRGVYNFGCEAIVRGAYKFFSELYPESEISYYSYNYEYDSKMLEDIPIIVKKIKVQRTFCSRVANKFLKMINCNYRILQFNYREIIDDSDIIVSIGGDIYTIPQYIREKKQYSYYNELVDFCNRAIDRGKQVILYGASVGPFGSYNLAERYYKDRLKKYKIIICREEESLKYLEKIGLTNACFFPDPAFQVKGNQGNKELKYIGVNISPLSLKETFGKYDENSIKEMSSLLDQLYESTKKDILFIPHVLSNQVDDNDFEFMKDLQRHMENKVHTCFADVSGGFLGLKQQLTQCYLVVSARMHCDINAIVENIPAIFLAYSQKSIGMGQYVYGNKQWIVDVRNISEELILKVEEMLESRELISEQLKRRNKEIDAYYKENIGKVIGE